MSVYKVIFLSLCSQASSVVQHYYTGLGFPANYIFPLCDKSPALRIDNSVCDVIQKFKAVMIQSEPQYKGCDEKLPLRRSSFIKPRVKLIKKLSLSGCLLACPEAL